MADELKAVALTAPEPSGWRHLTRADWECFGKHAGLPAIEHMLKQARADQRRAQRAVERLEALTGQREAQIAAGEWPPPVERVTWADLRPGDVIAHPDQDRPVLEVGTEPHAGGDWVKVIYEYPDGTTWHDSAPADREVPIRPRAEEDTRG